MEGFEPVRRGVGSEKGHSFSHFFQCVCAPSAPSSCSHFFIYLVAGGILLNDTLVGLFV